jgi:hypothetical protein
MNLEINIDVAKIDKEMLRTNKKGVKFLDIKTKEKPSEYSDGYVYQVVPKEKRGEGIRGPIVGNYKNWDNAQQGTPSFVEKIKPAPAFQNRPKPSQAPVWDGADDEDSIPF